MQLNWKRENFLEVFMNYDKKLDEARSEINLCVPEIATSINESIMQDNLICYDVLAYCIMSNHVHLLISFEEIITDKRQNARKG